MKITLKVSKRIRFYTMMIACCAFLWMMVRNNWINLETLGGYAFLVVVVIAIMVIAAAGTAWCIRKIAIILSHRSSADSANDAHSTDHDGAQPTHNKNNTD